MDKCKEMGAVRRYWPGEEPDTVCILHADDSQKIANAMGFALRLELISYSVGGDIPAEFPTCACSKGFSQTIEVT